jgi:hypothetical protein
MRSFLLALALLCIGFPGHAQSRVTSTPFGPSATIVSFTLQGDLLPSDPLLGGFQLPLLERLSQQENLAVLQTGGQLRSGYRIEFGFASVEEFRAWYTDAETEALMKEIASASNHAPTAGLTVRRGSMAVRMGELSQSNVFSRSD